MLLGRLVIWKWKNDFGDLSHTTYRKMKSMWIKTYMNKTKLQCWGETASFQYVSTCSPNMEKHVAYCLIKPIWLKIKWKKKVKRKFKFAFSLGRNEKGRRRIWMFLLFKLGGAYTEACLVILLYILHNFIRFFCSYKWLFKRFKM